MNSFLPNSLFGRTAALMTVTFSAFAIIVWFGILWTISVPSSTLLMADVMEHRIALAARAVHEGGPLPAGVHLMNETPQAASLPPRWTGTRRYLQGIATELTVRFKGTPIVLTRVAPPYELRIRVDERTNTWAVLQWNLVRPRASTAALTLLATATLLVIVASWWWARRLSLPLASLAEAANRVALGERAPVDTHSGPREVRSLANAFHSMSQRLYEAKEQREFMLAGVSHDLRSPLARLRIALELIDERDRPLAQSMAHEIEEMDRMLSLFLHYVRANYKEPLQRVVPDDVIRAAMPVDNRIIFELAANRACSLPANALHQIAVNLVRNALDHGRPPVRVRTRFVADEFELAVSDAGEGLSPEDWQHALEPFNRLRAPANTGHAGLGLALVDRLIRNVGGTLTATRGSSEFTIAASLPSQFSKDLVRDNLAQSADMPRLEDSLTYNTSAVERRG